MPRASWTGTLQFGLVEIPVRLVRATVPNDVRFHLVHKADGGRIHYKRVCALDGEEVPYEDIVRAFEVEQEEVLTVTPDELSWLEDHSPRTIEIEDFVDEREVDPVLFERTYFVEPKESGRRAYLVLLAAMERSGCVAIGRLTMRLREHLCALHPYRGSLAATTLRYAAEIAPPPDLNRGGMLSEVDPRELALAGQLIESMTTRFRHQHYKDDYRDRMVELLRRKARGLMPSIEPRRPAASGSLIEALSASLNAEGYSTSIRREATRTESPTTH